MPPKAKQKIKYDFIKILTGSDLSIRRLAVMGAESKKSGPVVWLTACVHGDEVGGIAVIQEIFKWLKTHPLLRGQIFAFPLMNPMGFETGSRHLALSQEDLNRSFPGNPDGSLAERVADKIFSMIAATEPDVVLDLHNDWIKSIPYTLIDPNPGVKLKSAYEATKKFAHDTGFVVINEQEEADDADDLKKSLSGSLLARGIPALTLELGGSYIVDELNVERGVGAVLNILSALKMIETKKFVWAYPTLSQLQGRVLKYSHSPASSTSGIIRFMAKPGALVKKGQPVARVYNVFGQHQETIVASADAVVLGNSDSAAALPGVPLMAFGIK